MGVKQVFWLVVQAMSLLSRLASVNSFAQNYNTPVHTLLLLRHGDSIWNGGEPGTHETFTGWTDIPLSQKGSHEAAKAGEMIGDYAYSLDVVFTSILQRAQDTARQCVLAKHKTPGIIADYRLNERHYGALQGFRKKDVENGLYGHDPKDVEAWRRSWHTIPPLLEDGDPRRIAELSKFAKLCGGEHNVPRGESLELVAKNRARPFLNEVMTPYLDNIHHKKQIISLKTKDKRLHPLSKTSTGLVVAHANSLRALIGVLCEVEGDPTALKILESLRIPTGVPLMLNYQRTPKGNFQVCELPEAEECVIDYLDGFGPPANAPPDLGHPSLPVWPLNKCMPVQDIFDNKLRIRQINSPEVMAETQVPC